jgi:hypothetical protein
MRLRQLCDESGQGLITGVIVIGALLVPLLFIIPLFARVELAHLAAEQTARDAVRSAVEAPDPDHAHAAADQALARGHARDHAPLDLTLSGDWHRGSVLRADARATVSLGRLPGLGRIGHVTVRADARAPIDRYRSLRETTP